MRRAADDPSPRLGRGALGDRDRLGVRGRPGQPLVKDKRKQARLLRRTFSRFAAKDGRWNLGGAFWYAWRDSARGEPVCAWCPRAGLISRSGHRSPPTALRRVLADAR